MPDEQNNENTEEEQSQAELSISEQWDEIVSTQARGGENSTASERILSQDEIDAIIGFEPIEDIGDKTKGLASIVGAGQIAYDRLPMLEVVFDRLVRLLTGSLRRFTSDAVDVALQSISSMRMEDYLNSTYLSSIMTVVRAEEWDNLGLITVDSELVFGVIEVLLGGAKQAWVRADDTRPFSSLEMKLVNNMVELIRSDIESAFEPVAPVTITKQRMETNPRFVSIVRPANTAVVATMRVDMDTRGGVVHVVFPHATLEPVRELLLQQFQGERFGRDNLWENHLAKELWYTELDLAAVIGECDIELSSLMNLKEGDTLMIDGKSDQSVEVRCEGISAFTGKIGKIGAYVAVSADSPINISHQPPKNIKGDNNSSSSFVA